ncbi:MAG TPA: outer membrane protein assembly factor BamD [Candidatus Eisenbacteria bacterium]|nr:outer membrane protein assembly factor BamD [Candidatus Eisenbacteria bacterium]
MTRRAARRLGILGLLATILLGAGCGGPLQEVGVGGVASYERGKQAFEREDWVDAIADLKAYVEQYPGTENTDDALFYLGESYFRIKDYVLAAAQYDRLTRDFPTSPYHPDALYQLARTDDLQSRQAALDQTETLRALSRYRDFIQLYPEHPKAGEARKRLEFLNDRLAEKRVRNGRLYIKLKQYDAATHYLERAISEHPDSRWACEARLYLSQVLEKLGDRKAAADTLRAVESCPATAETKRKALRRLQELERRD